MQSRVDAIKVGRANFVSKKAEKSVLLTMGFPPKEGTTELTLYGRFMTALDQNRILPHIKRGIRWYGIGAMSTGTWHTPSSAKFIMFSAEKTAANKSF